MMHKSKIKKLKNDLAGVSKKVIAERCKKSEVCVWSVLNGKYYNESVIKACVEYRDELKEGAEKLEQSI